ncbi:MAG: hypothetical protein R3C19_15200 [Planctomycetaceae bacterium]
MPAFKIACGTHKGKKIDVSSYTATVDGVEIRISHNVPTIAGKSLRWVQTVAENGSFYKACKLKAYVDPWGPTGTNDPVTGNEICAADDAQPYYWTDAEFTGGQGPGFYDKPSEPAPASGSTWIRFVTSLSEVDGTRITTLVSVVWGFDRLSGGKVNVVKVRYATQAENLGHRSILAKMYPAYKFRLP